MMEGGDVSGGGATDNFEKQQNDVVEDCETSQTWAASCMSEQQ